MTKESTQLTRIGTPMDTEMVNRLREIAEREDRSIASVIRRAVEREIARHEDAA